MCVCVWVCVCVCVCVCGGGVFLCTCFVFALNFFSIHVLLACLNVGFVCFPGLILPLYNDLVLNFGMLLQV